MAPPPHHPTDPVSNSSSTGNTSTAGNTSTDGIIGNVGATPVPPVQKVNGPPWAS
ncbi:hypothetical protein [Streptomyces sp. NPDC058629]|uniref:hypothetical protein n=1 Tax=Streptomyces sp. NPDC058629 TaxID=3346565 RepID=UPI003651DF70